MKIALFLPNWIGDAVMATPAVRAVRRHFRDAHLIGVMKPYVAGVVDGSRWLDSMVFLDHSGPRSRRWWFVAHALRRQGVDLAVLFPNSFRSGLIAWLAGSKRIVGFNRYGRGWMLTDALQPLWGPDGKPLPTPVIDDYNRLAERVGCPWPGYRMELFTTPADEAAADDVWRRGGLGSQREVICLNPGAAFGSSKHWYAESFATLAQELVDRRGSGILILCGPAERQLARRIAELTRRPGVHSLADHPLSLGLTKACIRRTDLLITTDSGPRHFADGVRPPGGDAVWPDAHRLDRNLLSPGNPSAKKSRVRPVPVARPVPLDHRCMKLLTPAEVFAAAQQLLGRSLQRKAS